MSLSTASYLNIQSVTAALGRHPVVAALIAAFVAYRMWPSKPRRSSKLPRSQERVIILGASGGMGRSLALKYAQEGAHVCIFARRERELLKVADECKAIAPKVTKAGEGERILFVRGDFTVVNLRSKVQDAWGGLDTLIVNAGVPTFRPFCELSDLEAKGRTFTPAEPDAAAIQRAVQTVENVTKTNYIGPVVSAATFIPALSSSMAPSIVLMASLAAVVPAPTLSLYNGSKAAVLAFYQSLATENPWITFTAVLPSTVRGEEFFSNAADGGKLRGQDPESYGLTHDEVVAGVLDAVDKSITTVWVPSRGKTAFFIYWLFPGFITKVARKRYGYPAAD
ncbi:NAD(P)-binding protein [Lentinus tigrinus ALCF2SS1-7]|uniref:NAD(P)-binding protein n=1 Tax=Lentinus tigrinus ALCF2SS1-6 TaxID=1328759 RepID=A0A5C2RTQ9_9APHY|nr:NAD(P)-binding protein [Lentinus tigrinus ALCF2SS1-6]RPD69246.1 NAD(P)-binding protein [Lentinus tigrinus ALCF2SS1-7]